MKYEKYHTVGTVPISSRKIVVKGKLDTYNTYALPLTFLTWHRHFNKKKKIKKRIHKINIPLHLKDDINN